MPCRIEQAESIASIAGEWSGLADAVGVSPFGYPGWIAAWRQAFGGGRLELLTAREGDALVGVLPLQRRWGSLVSTTNWHTPRYQAVYAQPETLERMLTQAMTDASGRLDLSFVDDSPDLERACSQVASKFSCGHQRRVIQRSPFIPLEGNWESFNQALPSRKRRKGRKSKEDLAEHGEMSFRVSDGTTDLDHELRTGFEIEASGWKGDNGTAIIKDGTTHGFYTAVARWAASRGWLRLTFLEIDGEAIAFGFGIEDANAHYDLKNGFHPDFSDCSPGFALAAERIERSFEVELERYEFLGAADRHKLDWTDDCHQRIRHQLFANGVGGRVEQFAWVHGRPLLKRALDKLGSAS